MAHSYLLHLRIRVRPTFINFGLSASSLLLLACLMSGCARHAASTAPAPQPSTSAQDAAKVVQPASVTLAEVNEAVTRVFKDAAAIAPKHQPNFFAGDFNGDSSPDIAVILQPAAGKLAEMNQEFPPWMLKDPFADPYRPAPPLRITADDQLLAIIHGYGPNGWRDSQATQTFLLKNAVGSETTAYTKVDFVNASQGKKVPRIVGDLISQNLSGKPGYLYFTGALYSWYDPKTFKGEPEIRVTHPGIMAKKKIDLLHPNLVAAEK